MKDETIQETKPEPVKLPDAFIPTEVESAEDTAARTYKEMLDNGDLQEEETETEVEPETIVENPETPNVEGEKEKSETPPEKQSVPDKEKPRDGKGKFAKSDNEVIQPPREWTAEAREYFMTMPKEVQKEHARVAKEFTDWRLREANTISTTRKAVLAEKEEVGSLVNMTRRWLPVWGMQNKTPEAALNEILNFNHLAVTDGEAALAKLAENLGIEIEIKNPKKGGSNPDLTNFENRLKVVESGINRTPPQEDHSSRILTEINSALELVKEEMNGAGRYVYPDLQDISFRQKLEPLFEGYCRSNPNATFEEAIRKTYPVAGGRIIPKVSSTNKLGTSQNGVDAARRASSSAFASGSPGKVSYEADPNETAEETAKKTYDAMFGTNR